VYTIFQNKISSSKDLQDSFYQLLVNLCFARLKKIIETQFNPVASHHLNLLEKKNMQKNILKRSFAKNTIKSSKKILFWRST